MALAPAAHRQDTQTAAKETDLARRARRDNPASPHRGRTRVKIYDIEVQRLRSSKHDRGMIELGIDVSVLPLPVRDDQPLTSCLRLPVEHARSLLVLLKQQLVEVDKLQPRSRRSGRS
ncbi:MAG TPA: hypothetical protein VF319_13195 [Caldimonas sp.]